MRPLIDAHLDLAWNALYFDRDLTLPLQALRESEAHMEDVSWRGRATVSFPELRRARVAIGVVTVLVRSGPAQEKQSSYRRIDLDYATPASAFAHGQGQLAYYRLLEAQGILRIIHAASDLDDHWSRWQADPENTPMGAILSMEGCDPIPDLQMLQWWYRDGLRAAGLSHYGEGRYAYGTGTDGPLSDAGRQLLSELERMGIALDITHLGDRCMTEVLDCYHGPVLASHHNCRALVPGQRQLTDAQIRKLVARDAVIGTALDAWMLYPGWQRGKTSTKMVTLEAAANHIDHICQIAGSVNHCAFGTDLDGGFGNNQTPHDLRSITDVHKVATILQERGYHNHEVDAIFFNNWLRFFRSALPKA